MRISITDRCNLRCRYCMPEGCDWIPMAEILTYEEILEIVKAAVPLGITRFKITGGEPLVRRDCAQLIRWIREVPGTREVTMTSNGILLKEQLPELVAAGLSAVNISLDTLDPERFHYITGGGNLETVQLAIQSALDSGLRVKLNTVLQKDFNLEEWPALLEMARKYPLDIRFIEIMPIGYGRKQQSVDNDWLLQEIQKSYPGVVRDPESHGNGPAVYYRIPGFQGAVGFISAVHGKFCDSCNRIRLSSTGKLKSCLCYSTGTDLREILRNDALQGDPQERSRRLAEGIREAIRLKPESHCFEDLSRMTENRKMVEIGG